MRRIGRGVAWTEVVSGVVVLVLCGVGGYTWETKQAKKSAHSSLAG
jgi:hypothetical protein